MADLVTKNINTAQVFKKHGLDFCCGGGEKIETVCQKRNVDLTELERELFLAEASGERHFNYSSWDLDFFVDHIVNVHHKYIEENIPLLLQYTERVVKVHGATYPEVQKIENMFHQVAGELVTHLKKEELILFPFIKKMVDAEEVEETLERPAFGTAENPVKMMEDEHEHAGELFRKIAKLSNNYTPPPLACNTFRAMYSKLEEFEQDLHLHIHLENNILFPKALELEKKIIQ